MTNNLPPVPQGPIAEPTADSEHAENAIELKEVEGLSQSQIVRRRFFRHRGAMAALFILIFIVLLAATSIGWGPIPGWWQWDYSTSHPIVNPRGAPTISFDGGFSIGDFPFGQDSLGRDIFARVMRGVQQSLTVMIVIGGLASLIGIVIGSLSGYFRGKLETVLMRFTDVVLTIPAIVIGAVLGKAISSSGVTAVALGLALGAISWTQMSRLVRGEFLSLREREFVEAAKVAGASNFRIIFKHMLPNAMGVIVVNTTLVMSTAILLETAISYIGFGISPPDISLGNLISYYQSSFSTRPWLFWWPGFFIVSIALCINFIGDGLRDAFDPRQRRIPSVRAMQKSKERENSSKVQEQG